MAQKTKELSSAEAKPLDSHFDCVKTAQDAALAAIQASPDDALNLSNVEEYVSDTPKKNVTIIRKSKGAVFVQGLFANSQTRRLYERNGYSIVERLEDSDIVVWTGGSDINPALYNEKPAGAGGWSTTRDKEDVEAVKASGDRFKVGICRGAQLLNVIPNGGTLWQDVDKHTHGGHSIQDKITGETVFVNSMHHQALRLTDKAELVAFTNLSTTKYGYDRSWHCDEGPEEVDVEAAWYPDTKSLCLQWHPEFAYPESSNEKYTMALMERYYLAA